MRNLSSFLNENSIALTLSPILKNILEKKYSKVIPLIPWITREGTKISKVIHKNDEFKVIGVYPRRPKINLDNDKEVYFKINEKIIDSSNYSRSLGLPIVCALPLVKNFWDLAIDPNLLWIDLKKYETKDYFVKINLLENYYDLNNEHQILKENDILDLVEESKIFNIETLIETHREINSFYNKGSFSFYNNYKPILFLVK